MRGEISVSYYHEKGNVADEFQNLFFKRQKDSKAAHLSSLESGTHITAFNDTYNNDNNYDL